MQKTLAWSVHAFTASGLLSGFMAILAINEKDWKMAMFWLIISLIIDALDGTLARFLKVKEVLPGVDGKNIDFVSDFANYAIIPAYCFYQAELVPEDWSLVLTFIILLVSALYYGLEGMVSKEMYFVGFPVLWNMVVFYLIFVFQGSPQANILLILIFSILHFVPIKFVYPSRAIHFKNLTLFVTLLFFIAIIGILYAYPKRQPWLIGLAYATAIYYGAMAIYDTWIDPKS